MIPISTRSISLEKLLHFIEFFCFLRSEVDADLLGRKSEVVGVLVADSQGLCLSSQVSQVNSGQVRSNLPVYNYR
jgi:hypothetical protein